MLGKHRFLSLNSDSVWGQPENLHLSLAFESKVQTVDQTLDKF